MDKMTPAQRVSAALTGSLPDDSPQSQGNRLSGDLQTTNILFAASIALGALIIIWHNGFHSALPLLWAMACLASGGGVGFLFGIPKILQGSGPPAGQGGAAPSANGVNPAPSETNTYQQHVNTNLEEISDWITKIIVGLGLINIKQIPGFFNRAAAYLVAYDKSPQEEKAFALALIIYFLVVGFLFGYLITRLFLQRALGEADRAAETDGRSNLVAAARTAVKKAAETEQATKNVAAVAESVSSHSSGQEDP